jgi:hypothetical protein
MAGPCRMIRDWLLVPASCASDFGGSTTSGVAPVHRLADALTCCDENQLNVAKRVVVVCRFR